jgi:hypothetical protein
MASLWTGLLFLHGHCCDWQLARRLARIEPPTKDSTASMKPPAIAPRRARSRLPWLRLCLGIGDGQIRRQ